MRWIVSQALAIAMFGVTLAMTRNISYSLAAAAVPNIDRALGTVTTAIAAATTLLMLAAKTTVGVAAVIGFTLVVRPDIALQLSSDVRRMLEWVAYVSPMVTAAHAAVQVHVIDRIRCYLAQGEGEICMAA
jgi:hypothetical protein